MEQFILRLVFAIIIISLTNDTIIQFKSTSLILALAAFVCLYFDKQFRDLIKLKQENSKTENASIIRENYEMSRALMNMSEQHTLLCEIRGSIARNMRYTKEALQEIKPRRFSDGHLLVKSIDQQSSTRSMPNPSSSPPSSLSPPLLRLPSMGFSDSTPDLFQDLDIQGRDEAPCPKH